MDVLDPKTMQPVPRNGQVMGEIFVRGNITMKGYLKNAQATAEAFAGGWFHTGDLAVIDADGYVRIKDRSKDIIISGGENISTIEIEDVLYSHAHVLEAAVVARPDEKWGEAVRLRHAEGRRARGYRTGNVFLPRRLAPEVLAKSSSARCRNLHRQDPEKPPARTGQRPHNRSHRKDAKGTQEKQQGMLLLRKPCRWTHPGRWNFISKVEFLCAPSFCVFAVRPSRLGNRRPAAVESAFFQLARVCAMGVMVPVKPVVISTSGA